MNKDFNKGLLLAGFGSFWWGFIGVLYFKHIAYIGPIELVVHRCLWTTFTLVISTFFFSKWDIFFYTIKNKKYLIYLFFFILLTTFNNLNLSKLDIFKIKEIDVYEENTDKNLSIKKNVKKDLMLFKNKNIFFLDNDQIKLQIQKNEWVSKFSIKKEYPSKIIVNLKRAIPIANIVIDEEIFFVGSNFKLIKSNNLNKNLPNIFGLPNMKDLKNFINELELSKMDYRMISDLYYLKSKRWNIKTKDGIFIKLPSHDTIKFLNLANKLQINKDIIVKDTIDLTVQDQIIIN